MIDFIKIGANVKLYIFSTKFERAIFLFFLTTCLICLHGCKLDVLKYHQSFQEVLLESFPLVKLETIDSKEFNKDKFKVFGSPSFLYKITPKSEKFGRPIYLFEKDKYVQDFGSSFDFKTKEICDHIEKVKNEISDYGKWEKDFKENAKILKKIKPEMKVNLPGGVVGVGANTDSETLHQIRAAFLLSRDLPGGSRVFVRGFADTCKDKSTDCKVGRLIKSNGSSSNYEYKSIKGHALVTPMELNAEQKGYHQEISEITRISDEYKNNDLPNLRAKFFKENILNEFTCSSKNLNQEIEILDGRVSKSDINPEIRKVELYLAVYN